jgi:hypothetical protein
MFALSQKLRLASVKSALTVRDKLVAKAEKLEAESLRAAERAILADTSRSDEDKLPELLKARGSIDLKVAAIADLRGVPSTANNLGAAKGKIEQAEEVVAGIGRIVGQLFKAWNDANIVSYHAHVAEISKGFVQSEDYPALRQLCARHPLCRQLDAFTPPLFVSHHQLGHAVSIQEARNLEAIWKQLQVNAQGYDDLSVSVHDAWID